MTVVYIDMLFLLNLIANYLLLLGAGRMAGAVLMRWRIVLGAAAGASYAVLLFLPSFMWTASWPIKIVVGALMPLIAYGWSKGIFRIVVLFFGASAGLAGLIVAVEQIGGVGLTLENGVLYSEFDLRLLLLLFVVCYFLMSLVFRRVGSHTNRELVSLEIDFDCATITLTALLDTGHTLTDPATNRPVIVAEGACVSRGLPVKLDLRDPVEGLKKCRMAGLSGFQLVPYRAVGVEHGMLLAIRAKSVKAGERKLGNLLIALSPNPVDDGGGYQALIGGI